MLTAADQFIRGKPLVYSGLDGALYVATYLNGERNGIGVGSLEIKNGAHDIVSEPIMGETNARSFFRNIDLQPE